MRAIDSSSPNTIVLSERRIGQLSAREIDVVHHRFDGSGPIRYRTTVSATCDAVGVLAYDPVREEVVLIEQVRAGALMASRLYADIVPRGLEVPAGAMNAGMSPVAVARQELFEETGCSAKEIRPIFRYLADPATSSNVFHLFCAEVDAREAAALTGLRHECEDIRVHRVQRAVLFGLVERNVIQNAATLLAAQWLLNRRHTPGAQR